ncbi:MAG: flagellar export protein FliJ [Treponema sp.]|jgi:flagellar FliJ protein|nr:flagellar export protein FliJ [Treponema sp.]
MKKFSFNMEKVLKLRKHHENETKMELGRAVGILSAIEGNIQAIAEERVRVAANQFLPGNNARDILQYSLYITRLDNTKEKLQSDAAAAELKVEEARGIYIEASRERKILDKLKEKQESEYRREFYSEETKLLDDIAAGTRTRNISI